MEQKKSDSVSENRIRLQCEKWVQNGYSLCHDAGGKPVFLHGGIPGEIVEASIVKERSTHSYAIAREYLDRAFHRVQSDCSSFPLCGGCSFRHISYSEELNIKKQLFIN